MLCSELLGNARATATADTPKYQVLHLDGRRLISGWFNRALTLSQSAPEECFEPFIFAWFAVNGWAAAVTGLDEDREYLAALMRTDSLSETFDRLMADRDAGIGNEAREFAGFWPIFRVQAVREAGINSPLSGTRVSIVDHYIRAGATRYQPQCWVRHKEAQEEIPIDWPHCLATLYRVRSNLFHGEKAVHSEEDGAIVKAAFHLLSKFFRAGGYL